MGFATPLDFQDIVQVLAVMEDRRATVQRIAYRLERGVSMVQRAVDRMVESGALEKTGPSFAPEYRLLNAKVQGMEAPMAKRRRGNGGTAEDGSDDPDAAPTGITMEQAIAARLWDTRMGTRRWQDDPRALRERCRKDYVIPPFYNLAAREV